MTTAITATAGIGGDGRGIADLDPMEVPRVSLGVSHQAHSTGRSFWARVFPLLAAAMLLVACGGKSKGAKSPKDDTKDPSSLTGSKADTSGDVKTTTNADGDTPAGTGDGAAGDSVAGGDGADGGSDGADGGSDGADGDGELQPSAKVEPPVKDLTEQEAATQVATHLKNARAALRGSSRDPNKAISAAKQALAVDPNNIEAVTLLAHAYYLRKLYSTGEVTLLRALSSPNKKISNRAQKSAQLYYVRGLIFDATGQPAKALLAYEKAHELGPTHRGAMMNLGVHYLRESRYAEAQALFEDLTGPRNVRTAAAWTNLASSYRGRSASSSLSKGQRDQFLAKAESSYKRAIDVNKNYAPAYYNLGLLYADAKPFPVGDQDMDELKRLERARTYLGEYRALPGAEITRVDEIIRVVDKALKKEKKRRKKLEKAKKKKANKKDDDW